MRRLSLALLLAAGCATPASQTGSTGGGGTASGSDESLPQVVAEAGGITITSEDMVRAMAAQEYQQRRELFQMRQQWIENEIVERMLKREADKEGLSVEQLLEKIDSSARQPTETDAQMFYKTQAAAGRMKDPQNGKTLTYDDVKDRIKQHQLEQAKTAARQQFFGKLMEGQEPKVHLQQPEPPLIADVSADDDAVKGSADAKVTIVEFSDFQCPACRQAHFQFGQVLEKYGDKVKFVYRDFPLLGKHPDALPAAIAANCAGKQDKEKYWTMHDGLFKSGSLKDADFTKLASSLELDMNAFQACMKDPAQEAEVRKDLDDGRKYGVNSTPTFYVNGYLVVGANMSEISRLVDRELAN